MGLTDAQRFYSRNYGDPVIGYIDAEDAKNAIAQAYQDLEPQPIGLGDLRDGPGTTTPANGNILRFDTRFKRWVAVPPYPSPLEFLGTYADLAAVNLVNPNPTTGQWWMDTGGNGFIWLNPSPNGIAEWFSLGTVTTGPPGPAGQPGPGLTFKGVVPSLSALMALPPQRPGDAYIIQAPAGTTTPDNGKMYALDLNNQWIRLPFEGPPGPPGETLHVEGFVQVANLLPTPASDPNLKLNVVYYDTATKHTWVFNPNSAMASAGPATPYSPGPPEVPATPPAGWVDAGSVEGPPGPQGVPGPAGPAARIIVTNTPGETPFTSGKLPAQLVTGELFINRTDHLVWVWDGLTWDDFSPEQHGTVTYLTDTTPKAPFDAANNWGFGTGKVEPDPSTVEPKPNDMWVNYLLSQVGVFS